MDDFALRKGRVYGSILVDIEQRRPIDLLPDRTAESLTAWLLEHPGVEVIARDRSTDYAAFHNLGVAVGSARPVERQRQKQHISGSALMW